jgi:hypothetical protein
MKVGVDRPGTAPREKRRRHPTHSEVKLVGGYVLTLQKMDLRLDFFSFQKKEKKNLRT